MTQLLERLRRTRVAGDTGLTLVEVIIALVIFSIITVGAITSVGTVLVMTRDNRSREVATNLASQAIDAVRSEDDIFDLANTTTTTPVGGATYTVTQKVSWLTDTGVDSLCTSPATKGNGALLYKHVNVTVTWTAQKSTTQAVRADTIVAPSSKINDPATGTILIAVTGATGLGMPNVTASVDKDTTVAGNTAVTPKAEAQPKVTNTDGCAVAVKVVPGTYAVTLGTAAGKNDVDPDQDSTPTKTVTVAAGDSTGVSFSYDAGDDFSMTYANFASNYTGNALVPTDLKTTVLSTGRQYTASSPALDQFLYPNASGYTFLAGAFVPTGGTAASCLSPDPESWPKTATNKKGKRPAPVSADVTSKRAVVQVPMGVATVNVKAGDTLIQATTTAATGGDPGCAAGMTYNFTRVAGATSATIALPYGTWSIKSGTSSTSLSTVSIGSLIGSILGVLSPGASTSSVVTLDPRVNS